MHSKKSTYSKFSDRKEPIYWIGGSSCAGKSTFARQFAVKYGYTYGTLFLLYFFIFFSSNSWNLDKILNFKSWYFTQGLWEMEGMWFWKAFIFETPFVLLRVLPLFFFLFLGVYYLLRSLINDDSTVITK